MLEGEIQQADEKEYIKILQHDQYFAENYQKIRTKAAQVSPFKYNRTQKRLAQLWEEAERKNGEDGRGVQFIILKSRQWGGSTFITGKMVRKSLLRDNTLGMILAHADVPTSNLYDITRRFQKTVLKSWSSFFRMFKPPVADFVDSRKELNFHDTDSRILCHTAGNPDVANSMSLQYVHFSELALYQYGKEILANASQTFTNRPGDFMVIESTARGAGTFFHSEWERAVAGESDFIPFFAGAWEHEENRMKSAPDFAYTQEEKDLKNRIKEEFDFNVGPRYFTWRRFTLRNKCQGDIDVFHQEYPEFPEDAFISNFRGVYRGRVLKSLLTRAKNIPFKRGSLLGSAQVPKFDHVQEDPQSEFSVWEEPQKGAQYYVGADTAEGTKDGDYSVLSVWKAVAGEPSKQVAEWRAHIEPYLFGQALLRVCFWYNRAYVVIESNNHGHAVIDAVKDKYPLHKIYKRTSYDERINKTSKKLGFQTNQATKIDLVNNSRALVNQGTAVIASGECIRECMTYIFNDQGRPNATPGCHDDCVIAMALALWGIYEKPPVMRGKKEEMVWVGEGISGKYVPRSMVNRFRDE